MDFPGGTVEESLLVKAGDKRFNHWSRKTPQHETAGSASQLLKPMCLEPETYHLNEV